MNSKIKNSYRMGLLCSIVGLLVGIQIAISSNGTNKYFLIFTTFSGFISPFILWHFIIERNNKLSLNRSTLVGLLGALLGHYLTFFISMFYFRIVYLLTTYPIKRFDEPIVLLDIWWSAFLPMTFSLLFYGWITIPAGGLIGYFYGKNKIKEYYKTDHSLNSISSGSTS